jgi:predicted ribosomally synthesized peptide with SipW-like signal peptide
MKKILISLLTVVIVGAGAVGATRAFFTATQTSSDNKLTAGTMILNILDQNLNSAFASRVLKTNWQPGENVLVNFDVKNDGSLPIQLRGAATGIWDDPGLDSLNKVKVVKVEKWNGSSFVTILGDGNTPITGYFYDSSNGLDWGAFNNLAAGDRAQFQLTVQLDGTADDSFQGHVFTSSLKVDARQTTPGATF